MYEQKFKYFDQIFSKFLCNFCKGFSNQNYLLYMIQKLKESLDQGSHYGCVLTDLLKIYFFCIMHDLWL